MYFRDTGKNKADNLLINGFGRFTTTMATPFATFHVKSGHSYRFRIVSPGFPSECPSKLKTGDRRLKMGLAE